MKILRVLLVLLAVYAGIAYAEIPTFKQLDRDQDKLLDRSEIEMLIFEIDISSADQDHDGSLNADEYVVFATRLRALEEGDSVVKLH